MSPNVRNGQTNRGARSLVRGEWARRVGVRMGVTSFAALLAVARFAAAAERLDRENQMLFHATPERVETVRSTADWQKRRAEVVAGMEAVMGPLPGPEKRVALDVRVENETDCDTYVRREITYLSEPNGLVRAFLLVPKDVLAGAVRPGILAAMPTNNLEGNRPVVGLQAAGGKPGRNYGEELARRGFVVIVPPYPHLAEYKPDLKGLGYASGTMKAIWDNMRALDVLAAMPGVPRRGFGAIGHSLGGHTAIFTAVFDDRITAVVSSCGFDSFLDYYAEKQATIWRAGQGWTQERYMPALANYAGRLREIPFDFHELVGALAPRAFLALSPRRDANFKWESVDRVIAAARPVFALHGVPERLAVEHPDCEHDFPVEMREKAYQWLERFLE